MDFQPDKKPAGSNDVPNLSWLEHDLRGELWRVSLQSDLLTRSSDEQIRRAADEMQTGIQRILATINAGLRPSQLLCELRPAFDPIAESAQTILTYAVTDAQAQKRCRTVQNTLKRAVELIEAAARRPEAETVDLNLLAAETQAAYEVESKQKGISFLLKLPADVKPIQAVRAEIVAVLRNLCANAIEAMPNGGTLSLESANAEADVLIQVSDTGVGMSKELQSTAFDKHVSTKGENRGLGLHLIRQMVRKNQSKIDLDSTPGQGTRFTIRFSGQSSP